MKTDFLKNQISSFFDRNPKAMEVGEKTMPDEFNAISRKVRKRIPKWYREVLTQFPLAGLEIGIPNDHGDKELVGKPMEELPLMGITFLRVNEIEENALNCFPDYELLKKNVIRFAEDQYVTQEGIFIESKIEDPAVRLVFHDFGETAKELLAESEMLLDQFSDIFKFGKLREKE